MSAVYIAVTYGIVSHHTGPKLPITRLWRPSSLGPFRLLQELPKVADAPDAVIESVMRGCRRSNPADNTDLRPKKRLLLL